jgi:hypothetical protein
MPFSVALGQECRVTLGITTRSRANELVVRDWLVKAIKEREEQNPSGLRLGSYMRLHLPLAIEAAFVASSLEVEANIFRHHASVVERNEAANERLSSRRDKEWWHVFYGRKVMAPATTPA